MRNNSAECLIGDAEGVFRAGEAKRLEPQNRRNKESTKSVVGVPRRTTDGRLTVDRPTIQVDTVPIPPLLFEVVGCLRNSN